MQLEKADYGPINENDKPYALEYMAQISVWLSAAGIMRGLGQDEIYIDPPQIPEV